MDYPHLMMRVIPIIVDNSREYPTASIIGGFLMPNMASVAGTLPQQVIHNPVDSAWMSVDNQSATIG